MKTILIADQDNSTRNLIRLLFTENMGYRVIAAESGKDAILKAKKIKPDIVLVDVFISGKDGYELSREIKGDPFLKTTTVFLLNSAFAPFNQEKIRGSLADDVITKPFGVEVVENIESLIRLYEMDITEFDSSFQRDALQAKKYIPKFLTLHIKRVEEQVNSGFHRFKMIPQVIGESLKGSFRADAGFMGNLKAPIESLSGMKSRTSILATYFRIPVLKISTKKYTDAYVALVEKLDEEKSRKLQGISKKLENYYLAAYALTQKFNLNLQKLSNIKTILQISITSRLNVCLEEIFTFTSKLKHYPHVLVTRLIESVGRSYQAAIGFMDNLKAPLRRLSGVKVPPETLTAVYFKLPTIKISGKKYIDTYAKFIKKLELEKTKTLKGTSKGLENYRLAAHGLAPKINLNVQRIKDIKTTGLISMQSYSRIYPEENPLRNHPAKFKGACRKLIGLTNQKGMKLLEIINRSFTDKLQHDHHLLTRFTKSFNLRTGILKDPQLRSSIQLAGLLKNSLLSLYGRPSVMILVDLVLVLSIITLIVFHTTAKEDAASPFGLSRPVSGASPFESRPNLGVTLIDHETFNKALGQIDSENVKQVSEITQDRKTYSKRTSKAARQKISTRELPQRNLEEVLRGAFLIQ